MKFLNGRFYVEVKDQRYIIHPTKNNILRLREEPNSLSTQYGLQNETQIRENQKIIINNDDELVVKNYPRK